MSSRTFKSPHRPLPAARGAGLKPWSLASPSPTGGARKIGGIAQSSFLQALRSAPIAPSSCCSGTQSAGLGKMSPRRRSRWTMMTRVAAILRAPTQNLCTPTAPGSVTFAKKLTDQVPTRATYDTDGRICPGHRGSSRGSPAIDPSTIPVDVDEAALREKRRLSEALSRSLWRCPWIHTCGEWNLSFQTKCWSCSTKRSAACETVLGSED